KTIVLFMICSCLSGCAIFAFGGAVKQTFEDQMLIEKHPEYDLDNQKIAIVINADLSVHYQHPGIANLIAEGIVARLAKASTEGKQGVKNIRILDPGIVARWQFETPQWAAMPSSDLATTLGVDRVIYIDLHEYRLTPPGNQWLWEGRCEATVGVIESNSYEQDGFADVYQIAVGFPRRPSVLSRQEANQSDISRGLLTEFMKQTAWLFYFHEEPKNPDRYNANFEK
ncbi:MAG: hypothetical protein QGF07_02290, partial [Phycisphaerales bacterium]|nr:hypothetical protein [Phycisphaerales bacterium]